MTIKFNMCVSFMFVFLSISNSFAESEIKIGSNACQFQGLNGRQFYIGIRGVDNYWIEYIDKKSLVLLLTGDPPLFDNNKEYSCERDTIVSFVKIPSHKENIYLNFDCHVVNDQSYALGELIFGYVQDQGMGLKSADLAWRASVDNEGHALIVALPKDVKVMCLNLPPIDLD